MLQTPSAHRLHRMLSQIVGRVLLEHQAPKPLPLHSALSILRTDWKQNRKSHYANDMSHMTYNVLMAVCLTEKGTHTCVCILVHAYVCDAFQCVRMCAQEDNQVSTIWTTSSTRDRKKKFVIKTWSTSFGHFCDEIKVTSTPNLQLYEDICIL